jgi:integral membrane protein (TIGR01906 family)
MMSDVRSIRAVQVPIQILLVVLLILLAVRIILFTANIWIPVEYHMPSFPEDRYGFSTEDRVFWSKVDIEYLLGDHDISYFDSYSLPDGSPMHNERELRHMQDVYDLIQIVWGVLGWGTLIAIIGLFIIGQMGSIDFVGQTLVTSARWTLILMLLLGLGLIAAFGFFFVGFHRIFFEGDTWIFAYSDTFIRLYPERFWRDTFSLVVVVALLETALLYLIGRFGIPVLQKRFSKRKFHSE